MGSRGKATLLVVLAAATLVACGSSGKKTTSSTTITAAGGVKIDPGFVAKVNAVCAKANARFSANGTFPFTNFDPLHPDPKVLPKVGAFFKPNAVTEQMIETQLRALGEPSKGAAQWDAIRALAIAAQASAIKQVHAALASDVNGFVATVNEGDRIHRQLATQAPAAGFSGSSPCAKIF